jgi:hypothetical protein
MSVGKRNGLEEVSCKKNKGLKKNSKRNGWRKFYSKDNIELLFPFPPPFKLKEKH